MYSRTPLAILSPSTNICVGLHFIFRLNSNLMALQLFNTMCHKDLDGDANYFSAGSGLICISIATFSKDTIYLHMVVPVPNNVKELTRSLAW